MENWSYLPVKLVTQLKGPMVQCNVVRERENLLLCMSLEWLKDGLCSQVTLPICLPVVFRSSVFAFFSLKKKAGGYI